MVIYAWVYVMMTAAGLGATLAKDALTFTSIFGTLMVMPFVGRVLGWW